MGLTRDITNGKAFFARVNRGERSGPPLRTMQELAEEFGISVRQLAAQMRFSEFTPPAPVRETWSHTAGTLRYFEPHAMREWWARHWARKAGVKG